MDGWLNALRSRVRYGTLTPETQRDLCGPLDEHLRAIEAAEFRFQGGVNIIVGVNGVGKTTTIGKIATAEAARGTSVLMAAGDTFRAAAAEQLQVWAERSGASFVRGAEGGDPASVIFDGIQSAAAKGITLVLGDTAGRLQNKSNLMEELKKVRRVADKAPGTVNEVLLVIDATTGQNGLSQAREFAAATDVTGVVNESATPVDMFTVIKALHPSAAVCGTPTDLANDLIAELEQMNRGRYAGPVGWIDANGDGEIAIALRCGLLSQDKKSIRIFAGCGIVAGSNPANEFAESQAKLMPMRTALETL